MPPIAHESLTEWLRPPPLTPMALARTSTPESSTKLIGIVPRILAPLSRTWVRDFLFNSSPEADLSIITSPTQMQHALVGKLESKCTDEHGNLVEMLLGTMDASWLMIPAYCIEGLSAFILVEDLGDRYSSPSAGYLRTSARRFIRVVCDNVSGGLLGVSHDPEEGIADMVSMSPDKSVGEIRTRCFVRFDSSRLPNKLADAAPSAAEFVNTLICSHIITESRVCASCGPVCLCPAIGPLLKPKHPLDFSTVSRNMLQHIGSFAGTCLHTIHASPSVNMSFSFFIQVSMSGGHSPGVLPRLHSWAVASRMAAAQKSFSISQPFSFNLNSQSFPFLKKDSGTELNAPLLSNAMSDFSFSEGFQVPAANLHSPSAQERQLHPAFDELTASLALDSVLGASSESSSQTEPAFLCTKQTLRAPAPSPATAMSVPDLPVQHTIAAPAPESREAKELRRKLRNRESAARSNLKKQLRGQELKRDIAAANARAEELRARLALLQEENARLRAATREA